MCVRQCAYVFVCCLPRDHYLYAVRLLGAHTHSHTARVYAHEFRLCAGRASARTFITRPAYAHDNILAHKLLGSQRSVRTTRIKCYSIPYIYGSRAKAFGLVDLAIFPLSPAGEDQRAGRLLFDFRSIGVGETPKMLEWHVGCFGQLPLAMWSPNIFAYNNGSVTLARRPWRWRQWRWRWWVVMFRVNMCTTTHGWCRRVCASGRVATNVCSLLLG